MQHGDQKKIAAWLKVKNSFLSKIFSTGKNHKRPSPARAEELEKISGVSFRTWLRADPDLLKNAVFEAWEKSK